MVFPKNEFASGGVWARDSQAANGQATPRTPLNPVVTVDGRWTGTPFRRRTQAVGGPGDGYVVETAGGAPRRSARNARWTNGRGTDGSRLSAKRNSTGSNDWRLRPGNVFRS